MREDVLELILCPACRSARLEVDISDQDEREIREGQLICSDCGRRYPIHKGIIDLLPDPGQVIRSEQRGWVEMLGETSEELVETMLKLPYLEDDAWITGYENFNQVMSMVRLVDKRVLDIGAGRCWSTRRIIMAGASQAIGLDILIERFIGLETADIYLQHDDLYFERVLGDMNDLPMRPGSFDVVFMSGTLHHSSDVYRTMREIGLALAPEGVAIVINEPVRSLLHSKSLVGCPEIEHGINEHVYRILEYLMAARCNGLRPSLFFPRSIARGLDHGESRVKQEMGRFGYWVVLALWRYGYGRKIVSGPLLPFVYLIASMPLVMIAKKSGSGENGNFARLA